MTAIRRATLRKLAATAYEMDLDVQTGQLRREEDGSWTIGGHDLLRLLEKNLDQEIVLVLGSMVDERPIEIRTCRTCGRDYQDIDCPHCRASRVRLRGASH